jgi:TPR repeat protein
LARETGPKTAAPLSADAIADMVQRGQALIASGKILAARSVLREAADANSVEAALALGMTYDRVELDRLGIRDIAPEADAARHWYQKARELGSAEAQGRLDRLAAREGQAH